MRSVFAAAALLTLVTSVQAEDLVYDIRAGQPASQKLYVYVEDTCVSSGQYRSKVLQEPTHGKLDIRPDTFIAEGPPCDGRKFVGTRVTYTPAKGFRGTDHLSVSLGYPTDTSGMRYSYTTYNVTLNVR